MVNQAEWIKVVTDPLGLGGFALFLTFLILLRTGYKKTPWLPPIFVTLAFISLVGGLVLSYFENSSKVTSSVPEPRPTISIKAETHGPYSPVIGINEGDQNIGNQAGNSTKTPDD